MLLSWNLESTPEYKYTCCFIQNARKAILPAEKVRRVKIPHFPGKFPTISYLYDCIGSVRFSFELFDTMSIWTSPNNALVTFYRETGPFGLIFPVYDDKKVTSNVTLA
jgi:hypothetical protein